MTTVTKAGRVVGALMLVHLISGLIGPYVILVPTTAPPAVFLDSAAPIASAIRASVCVLMAAAFLPVLMATIMTPVLGAAFRTAFLWLIVLSGVNLALQFAENAHWLTMLSVSQSYQLADEASRPGYAVAAVTVRSAFKWAHYGHILVLVSWLLVLYVCFLRARLVPGWLAAAGIVAALLHLAGIPIAQFVGYRVPADAMWGIPLAVVYLSSALWLMARGFPDAPDDSSHQSQA